MLAYGVLAVLALRSKERVDEMRQKHLRETDNLKASADVFSELECCDSDNKPPRYHQDSHTFPDLWLRCRVSDRLRMLPKCVKLQPRTMPL